MPKCTDYEGHTSRSCCFRNCLSGRSHTALKLHHSADRSDAIPKSDFIFKINLDKRAYCHRRFILMSRLVRLTWPWLESLDVPDGLWRNMPTVEDRSWKTNSTIPSTMRAAERGEYNSPLQLREIARPEAGSGRCWCVDWAEWGESAGYEDSDGEMMAGRAGQKPPASCWGWIWREWCGGRGWGLGGGLSHRR